MKHRPAREPQFARLLRVNLTDAERRLWSCLRGRTLAGLKFRRQHPLGPYILDFFCAEVSLAVELDGSQHLEPDHMKSDQTRTAWLRDAGIRVVRFFNDDVLLRTEQVLEAVLTAATEDPSP